MRQGTILFGLAECYLSKHANTDGLCWRVLANKNLTKKENKSNLTVPDQ